MSEIAYQNKDIASKVFAEKFRDISLNVYGINLPKIVEVLPTNLPEISANELRIDNLFLLEDGRVAVIDYESAYKKRNHIKYLGYIYRVLDRYFGEGAADIQIVVIVIYTADVKRSEVKTGINAGAVVLKEEAAFLSELPSEKIRRKLDRKIKTGEDLSDEEKMGLILLPLSYKKEQQGKAIEDAINMAKEINDEDTMVLILSGILVFSDKVIDDELSRKTKEWISKTKVGRLFAEEAEQKVARTKIEMIETLAKSDNSSIEEACKKVGISPDDYNKAKNLLSSSVVSA